MFFDLWSKNISTNQNAGFFKQYLTNELRCEVKFLRQIRHSSKQQTHSVISASCVQACLGMLKVMQNSESASSQE